MRKSSPVNRGIEAQDAGRSVAVEDEHDVQVRLDMIPNLLLADAWHRYVEGRVLGTS